MMCSRSTWAITSAVSLELGDIGALWVGIWVKPTCQSSPGWCPWSWCLWSWCRGWCLWRAPCGLDLAHVWQEDLSRHWFLDTVAELFFFQKHAGTCKTAGVDLYLGIIAKPSLPGLRHIFLNLSLWAWIVRRALCQTVLSHLVAS